MELARPILPKATDLKRSAPLPVDATRLLTPNRLFPLSYEISNAIATSYTLQTNPPTIENSQHLTKNMKTGKTNIKRS